MPAPEMATERPPQRPGEAARAKLVEFRAELIRKLDRRIEGGDLTLIANVQLAIVAIDDADRWVDP
ncbi:MAG TPA: hypothetical protein VFQ82_03735 [Stellaceae bacterium]|jgi:hypothetical protein|nr:hypothetical protein [Stellaceae bacterium]